MSQLLLDLSSLDSSVIPDLSLNSPLHQHSELPLGLVSPISLPDLSTSNQLNSKQPSEDSTNQLVYDLRRHSSKRWTSFSELGKSVLRLKSFDRSTIHGSSPYLSPKLVQTKPIPTYSASHHRHLSKLFHHDHPPIIHPLTQPELSNSASSHFTLPILPTMSESLATSFDKELSSIVDQPTILEESPRLTTDPIDVSLHQNHSLQSEAQRPQSLVSAPSDPVVVNSELSPPVSKTSIEPLGTEKLEVAVESNSPSTSPALPTFEEDTNQVTTEPNSPTTDLPPSGEEAREVDPRRGEEVETITNKVASIEILNRSDESQSNEELTTASEPPLITTTTTANDLPQNANDTLGRKKKFGHSAGLFKLFINRFGHLKPGHSSSSSNNSVPTTTIP